MTDDPVVVAVATTLAEAEFVKLTLVAHGLLATISAADPAHPVLNFVDGVRVSVPADQEEQARALLGQAPEGN